MQQRTQRHRIVHLISELDALRGRGLPRTSALDGALDALRGALDRLRHGGAGLDLRRAIDDLEAHLVGEAPDLHARVEDLVAAARAIDAGIAPPSLQIPSRPLFGVLPVARLVPQDVHSVMDYVNGVTAASAAFLAGSASARAASAALGVSVVTVSAMTDYKLSLAKVIPIEAHEAIDYGWALAAIAAPFVLGYARRDPIAAILHIACGVGTILSSLVTDYRAARGRGAPRVEGARHDATPATTFHPAEAYHA